MVRAILACACVGVLGLSTAALAGPRVSGGDDNGGGSGGGGSTDVIRPLVCTAGGTGKLKLGRDDGNVVDVEFELQHVRANRRWRITLRHNGVLVTNITRTSSSLGRITIHRRFADRAGNDRITGVAQRLPSGQRCTATGLAPNA